MVQAGTGLYIVYLFLFGLLLMNYMLSLVENSVGTFEFHIISLDGRYWVFDAGSSEVILLNYLFVYINDS